MSYPSAWAPYDDLYAVGPLDDAPTTRQTQASRIRYGVDHTPPPCEECSAGQRTECSELALTCAAYQVYSLGAVDSRRVRELGHPTDREPVTPEEWDARYRAWRRGKRKPRDTSARDTAIRALLALGKTQTEIAVSVGCGKDAVRRIQREASNAS